LFSVNASQVEGGVTGGEAGIIRGELEALPVGGREQTN